MKCRSLRVERLETREVLSGGTSVCLVPPALPPSAVAAIVATPPVGKAVMAAAQVALTAGQQFTFGQEGFRAAPYHPTSGSGVTIGVGYDMSQRSATSIVNDLVAAGVDKNTAQKLAKAAGLTGSAADVFVRQNLGLTITEAQGKALFVSIYNGKADYAQSLATKADVVKLYGPTDWAKLNQRIKDILVDMTYRGDYTPQARTIIQKYLVKNDLAGFRTAMANRANWPDVPKARFDARVAYLRA